MGKGRGRTIKRLAAGLTTLLLLYALFIVADKLMRAYRERPFTEIRAESAYAVIFSRCAVGTIFTEGGGELRVYTPVEGTLPAGSRFTICDRHLQDRWMIEISDSVNIDGRIYKGSKEHYLSLLINEDGTVTQDAAIRAKDVYFFYPFF